MKMKWTFLVASLATTGLAHAAEMKADDLTALAPDPQDVLEALVLDHNEIQSGIGGRKERRLDRDSRRPTTPPKACVDAGIRDDQKTAIENAVLDTKREKIQTTADLKVAMMDYARTAMDQNSDKSAAEAAAGKIVDGVQKLAAVQVGLVTRIVYDLVTPEQRKNTFLCLVELHKQQKKHKRCHDDDDHDDKD